MIGSPADGIPGELEVKVKPNIRSDAIVKIMLELTTSACEGKLWRSSNTDNAVMEAITCSDLSYVEGFGFDASDMSDAAVMWVCDNDAVEYVEAKYTHTTPIVSSGEPDDGSGSVTSTSTPVMPIIDDDDSSGSGMNPVSPAPSTCSKLRGELLPVNNYLIKFVYNSVGLNNMDGVYKLMESVKKADPSFDTHKIKPLVKGSKKGFYYNGLSKDAVMKFCESNLVDDIEVQKETSTTVPPQTTSTPTPFTPSAKCNKIKEYKDEGEETYHRYIVILYESTSSSFIQLFLKDLLIQSTESGGTMKVKNIQPLLNLKMFTAEMNIKSMEYVCENTKVKLIEMDITVNPLPSQPESSTPTTTTTTATTTTTTMTTTTPSTITTAPTTTETLHCSKLRGGEIKPQGLNLCRIYLKRSKTKHDCKKLVRKLKAMDNDPASDIQVEIKEVRHHSDRPMIIAKLNLKALDTVRSNIYGMHIG